MKYKTGDLLIDRHGIKGKYWSVLEVIHTYKDSNDDYYWVKTLYYETGDASNPTYMNICDDIGLGNMRKLKKGEYEEILAKVL